MVNPLAPWGIDPRAEELYRQLLRLAHVTSGDLIAKHGWNSNELETALRALVRARLVKSHSNDQYEVVPPVTAINDLVNAEEVRLASRSAQLEAARKALREYASEFRSQTAIEVPAAELVSFGQWDEKYLYNLIAAADGPLRIVYSKFVTEAAERLSQLERIVNLGYPVQVLIPAVHMDDQKLLSGLRSLKSLNAKIRLGSDSKTSFTVYGSLAASSLTNANDFRCDRLVIRIPAIIDILTSYFDSIWQRSIAVDATDVDEGARILALLGEGLKDETVARHLGISLRTVRRRIADFMDEIGAETRFQAGAEAQRRGMV